jgi:hypothetical protein
MSLTELLTAIRALPKAERVALLHLLVDDVTAPAAPTGQSPNDFCIPEAELRKMFPPGYVGEIWFPEANPEAVAAAMQALKEFESNRE